LKKDKKALRLVHDLQPLNAVVIKDSAVPPMIEPYAESFGGRACYALFNLFVVFDQRSLAPQSRDLTMFQTPLRTFRLTSIPMGYTNSMQIFHGDTTFLLQDEIPHVTIPFIDDLPIKGPKTRYQGKDGTFETIPQNKGIRRLKHAGATLSGVKLSMCTESAEIVRHKCTIEGRLPNDNKIQKNPRLAGMQEPYRRSGSYHSVSHSLGKCLHRRLFPAKRANETHIVGNSMT
jgi:hypothetical protein